MPNHINSTTAPCTAYNSEEVEMLGGVCPACGAGAGALTATGTNVHVAHSRPARTVATYDRRRRALLARENAR